MSNLESLPLFDYAALDPATSKYLKKRAAELKSLMRQTVDTLIKTGNILIEVKSRLPHGQWTSWCETEFGWSQRTARQMIHVAETFSSDNLSDLDIAASALYILSAPSTPEEVREEALFLARKGQTITYTAAKEMREQYLEKENIKPKRGPLPEAKPTDQQSLNLESLPEHQPLITPPPADFQPVEATVQTEDKPQEVKSDAKTKSNRRERLKKDATQPSPALIIDKSLIKSKAKTVEEGQTWRLGGFHILFCGEPTDPRFIKRLPRDIALLMEFPPSRKLLPESFTEPFESYFAFSSKIKTDFDLGTIREIVQTALEGTTDGGDSVALYCLPDPAIFLLLDQLECIAFCAEPDPHKCNMAIAAWTTVTKREASRI